MKKRIILFLSLVLAFGFVASKIYADATVTTATKARAAATDKGLLGVYGQGDVSTGNTQEVDSRGAASVLEYPKTIGVTAAVDALIYTGACRVYTINAAGSAAAAGDKIDVYDATSATGTPKFEISVGTAKETNTITIPGGATFATGIYIDQSGGSLLATVAYDY